MANFKDKTNKRTPKGTARRGELLGKWGRGATKANIEFWKNRKLHKDIK